MSLETSKWSNIDYLFCFETKHRCVVLAFLCLLMNHAIDSCCLQNFFGNSHGKLHKDNIDTATQQKNSTLHMHTHQIIRVGPPQSSCFDSFFPYFVSSDILALSSTITIDCSKPSPPPPPPPPPPPTILISCHSCVIVEI